MNGIIRKLKDNLGNIIFPVTPSKAVYMEDGVMNLDEKITEQDDKIGILNTSLNDNVKQIKEITYPTSQYPVKPIITFIDDDGRIETYNLWKALALSKDIKMSFAIIPNWIENGQSTWGVDPPAVAMNKTQLQELYNDGHEFLSHGYDTKTLKDILNNPVELEHQLKDSRQWFIDNGFTRNNAYDYLVYPQGLSGDTATQKSTKAEVKKYYKYGINAFTTSHYLKPTVFDSYDISRLTSDGATSAYLKAELDTCIANNGWMIVLSHAYHVNDNDGGNSATWSQRYIDLIDYAKTKGVDIMPFGEAIKLRGNIISAGEYLDSDCLYINKNGSMYQNISKSNGLVGISTPYAVPANAFTKLQFTTVQNSFISGEFDTVNYELNITNSGYYDVSVGVSSNGVLPQAINVTLSLFVNGVEKRRFFQTVFNASEYMTMSGIANFMKFNVGDKVSIQMYAKNYAFPLANNIATTFCSWRKVES